MRLTIAFSAMVQERDSNKEVRALDSFNGQVVSNEHLEVYFDSAIADEGIVGGDIQLAIVDGRAMLHVIYWVPQGTNDDIIERLKNYTIAQLDDGVGEGGFTFVHDLKEFRVTANTDSEIEIDNLNDGRSVPQPPRIAIAARDGKLDALSTAVEQFPGDLERLCQGYSALQLAVLYGHIDAVRVLLAAGADPARVDREGASILQLCALSNKMNDEKSRDIAQMLIAFGADPRHSSKDGQTARSFALIRGKLSLAELL